MDREYPLLCLLKNFYCRMPRGAISHPGIADELAEELLRLYSQEHRHYHNLRHIEECLHEFGGVSMECSNPITVEMALWYHDIVYEPTATGNERLSANKALFDCLRLGIEDKVFHDAVMELILATRHVDALSGDAALVADIDLAILGSPWERFSEYESQIRKEYAHVNDKEFSTGRQLILDGFMRRPQIYQTNTFRNKYEKLARANIALSLMKLRSQNA
jgi:predicted metal-dependent HD superfamily phosphohydrolase